MKASLFTLLPLACFMQSTLAAPAVAEKDIRAIVGAPAKSEVAERGLLDGLLGSSGSGSSGSSGSGDITDVPQLGQLSVLVTNVVQLVQSIGTYSPRPQTTLASLTRLDPDGTLTGAGGNLTSVAPVLTGQLTQLQSLLAPLQSITSGLPVGGLNLSQIADLASLLARLFNAVATLVTQLSTVTCMSLAPWRSISILGY